MSRILALLKGDGPPLLLAVDVETSGLDRTSEIISIAVGWRNHDGTVESESYYLDRFGENRSEVPSNEPTAKEILDISLFNNQYTGLVLFHNINFDMPLIIKRFRPAMKRIRSTEFSKIADTAAISRVLKNNSQSSHVDHKSRRAHSLKYLADALSRMAGNIQEAKDVKTYDDVVRGLALRFADQAEVERYNRQDTELTIKIYFLLKDRLAENEWRYIEEIENPHSFNLLHLTFHGVPCDKREADDLFLAIEAELDQLQAHFNRLAGRAINLESNQDLARAIFHNHRLTYRPDNDSAPETLRPLYVTDKEQSKVDLNTLESIYRRIRSVDQSSPTLGAMAIAMRHIELTKSRSSLELLDRYSRSTEMGRQIFPNISANAASGRVTCSRPNLLGMPKKIFKKSKDVGFDFQALGIDSVNTKKLADTTVREVIQVPEGYNIGSIDINGLDLVVIAHGAIEISRNDDFYWKKFINKQFGETIDSHFALLQRFDGGLYQETFSQLLGSTGFNALDYWAKKPSTENEIKGIWFIHKTTGEKTFVPYPDDGKKVELALEAIRELSKKFNFATSYLVGAPSLATKLREVGRDQANSVEAEKILNQFYACFPELRMFQDRIGNLVYQQGYVECPFGRRFYPDVWDQLNAYYRRTQVHRKENGTYEFIIKGSGRYWYIRAHEWIKDSEPVIENLRIIPKPFGLQFRSVSAFMEVPRWIFNEAAPEKHQRKRFGGSSENNTEDVGEFVLNRVAMTDRVDRHISFGLNMEAHTHDALGDLIQEGAYLIPERQILLYRVSSADPSSQYFRRYKPLLKVAKKFFPNYCQAVAATVAKKALTHARRRIEQESSSATILFFIHDQIDVMFEKKEEPLIKEILQGAVELDMSPFSLRFSGEYKNKGRKFR